jgi:DNA-binding transcriptional LysR family regulator
MSLTDEGHALLRHCQAIEELEGQFLSRVSGQGRQENSLTIVGPTSPLSTRVPRAFAPLYKKYPHLRLHLQSEDNADCVDLVRRGEADFAIVPADKIPNEMDGKILKPDKFLLLASAAWKGRKLSDILENERVIDFNDQDSVTLNYLKHFNLTEQLKRSRLFVNENDALIHLFKEGVGFGVLTETIARPYVESGELITLNRGQTIEEPIALIWYPRSQKPDYFQDIITALR